MMHSFCICSWLLILTATLTEQQQCSANNLPVFRDNVDLNGYLGIPPNDRLQAIVPALNFSCTGRVTEWRACVDQGGSNARYYMQFQVWRSTGVQGCYTLVGSNASPLGAGDAVVLSLLLRPSDQCLVLQVAENEQIEFQQGDLIGYYTDQYRGDGFDRTVGGVQVIEDNNVVVYHIVDVPLSDLKTEYAIPSLGADPAACGFNIATSTSTLHDLSIVTSGAPIITVSLVTVINPTTTSLPSPSSTVAQVTTSATSDLIPTTTVPVLTSTPPVEVSSSSSMSVMNLPHSLIQYLTSTLTVTSSLSPTSTVVAVLLTVSTHPISSPTSSSANGGSPLIFVVVGTAGLACVVLILISMTTIITTILLYMMRKRRQESLVDNVAYQSSTDTGSLKVKTNTNMAYGAFNLNITTSDNEAYGITEFNAEGNSISTSTNEAYGAPVSKNESHTTALSTDKTGNIATSIDRDYADPDIPASVMGDLLYDYVRV